MACQRSSDAARRSKLAVINALLFSSLSTVLGLFGVPPGPSRRGVFAGVLGSPSPARLLRMGVTGSDIIGRSPNEYK
jgi:hypothetical protein